MKEFDHINQIYDLTDGLHFDVELLIRVVELQRQQIDCLRRAISELKHPELARPRPNGEPLLINMPTDVVIESAFSDMVRSRES